MAKKQLIVNADDLGQSYGINQGIMQAHEQGIVTSASLMVRYEAVVEAVQYGRANDKLSIGLHVDLGEWRMDPSTPLGAGEWRMLYEVVNSIEDVVEVEFEVRKQLNMFYKMMGRGPTHIDSHQHVHQREYLKPLFQKIADELKVPLRHNNDAIKYCGSFYGQNEKGDPYPEGISVNGLTKILENIGEGITELACHPAFLTDIDTMYKLERQIELSSLCAPAIKEVLDHEGIELISFKSLID
jgi:predicted glycoside hydrolase/deacetylase ChbG (UPF0249 family)